MRINFLEIFKIIYFNEKFQTFNNFKEISLTKGCPIKERILYFDEKNKQQQQTYIYVKEIVNYKHFTQEI